MSYEPKIRLNIALQGSVMMSEQECSKNPKSSYESFSMKFPMLHKKTKKKSIEYVHVNKIRKCIPARQVINISNEAYFEMIGTCPAWEKLLDWKRYSVKQKLNSHFSMMTKQLGGISFSYEFLDK